jgi:two-component system, chemotaxis family, sensor kinase CheA
VNLEKYRALFVEEASEHLAEMARALAQLAAPASEHESREAIDLLFRMTHSIKGMAASLDYGSVAMLSHRLEDWLGRLREHGEISSEGIGLATEALHALEAMVRTVEETGFSPPPRDDLVARLHELDARQKGVVAKPASAPRVPDFSAPPLPRSVRVRTEMVDRFLAAVGDLMQLHGRLETLNRATPEWEGKAAFSEELGAMDRTVRELRRRALNIRTTPVKRVLERLPRVASELARALGKSVKIELHGEEVEVDRGVLDQLDDPLLHLVRNAIDHGVELPADRAVAGKSPIGVLRVRASSGGGRLQLSIEDDGRGIDVERVRQRAVERGLLPEAVAEDLPVERLCDLLFEPGMSTRDEVTEISGRGVGLDVVKRGIEALGGTVVIRSQPGQGTIFDLDLPVMVALQRVLVLQVKRERMALPVRRVDCVVDVKEAQVERSGDEAFCMLSDEPLPLVDLSERMGLGRSDDARGAIVVLDVRGLRIGLKVDRALADQEVFVREVPPVLARLKSAGGLAVLPDGVPVFLLETSSLVEALG